MKTARKLAVGELINQYLNDSAVFRSPVLYNQRLPDYKSGMITVQKTPITPDYDAFAPKILGLSQPRTQFPLDSAYIIHEKRPICKSLYGTYIETAFLMGGHTHPFIDFYFFLRILCGVFNAPIAQLDNASASEAGDCRFESRWVRQKLVKVLFGFT